MATSTVPREPAGRAAGDRAALGLVADAVGRRRLQALLGEDAFELAASADSVHALLELDVALALIVLVGDARAVSRGGPIERLQALRPGCSVVLVAPDDDCALVRKALRGGVEGYVPEPAVERALVPTISAVLSGQLAVPRSIRRRAPWAAFSARERQVLLALANGSTNQEIASQLHLSQSTVKSHLASSFRKLGVSCRAEAATAVLDIDAGLNAGTAFTPPAPPQN